jgi:hypothetical protein
VNRSTRRVGVDGSEGDEIVFDKDDDEYDVEGSRSGASED